MEGQPAKIAVFVSGGGSNLQALIDATKAGILVMNIKQMQYNVFI